MRGVLGADVINDMRSTRQFGVSYYLNEEATEPRPVKDTDYRTSNWNHTAYLINSQLLLDYNKTFGKHNVSGLFGVTNESFTSSSNEIEKKGVDPDLGIGTDITNSTVGNITGKTFVDESNRTSLTSLLGRVGYSYADRYYTEFSFRYDASSKFHKDYRWGFFPSVSLGWRLSEENFMQAYKERVGDLKLRTSFGILGNQSIGTYDRFTVYELYNNSYAYNNQTVSGAGFKLGKDNLTWEKTKTFNVGVDASFFNNALNVTFDYFYKRTSDILMKPLVPSVFGTDMAMDNIGEMQNQGWDLSINYRLKTGAANHNFNFNLGDSWNEVLKYPGHERILTNRGPLSHQKYGPVTVVDHAKMYKDTEELLKKLKLEINPRAKLGSLSIAQMQMVEIAKAVSANCKVLILDEPTSSLTANEVESLFRIMRELKEQGVALVYISHKMDEIKVIADEVTIMRDGHYIGKWNVAEMTKEQIIAKMVGRELSNLFPPLENHPSEEVMMKVEDFTSIHPRSFRHCSFELKKGEILGVAGLVGAQRTELMEGIFGLRAHTSGKVWIKGEEVNIKQPRDAIQKSVALLTEDRRATGIMGVLSVADNISIASLDALRKGPIMLDDKKILDLVATNKEKMAIKVPSPKTQIKSLSGGNQQKVLIARWLANNPDVLILDEPTRGIDVGAKYEIYCIIADLAKQGKSIIMISSEMSEIIGMSNRVMVMCDGRITGFIDGKDATQENIMELATQFETAPETAAANQ